jgi:hypothetical protein
MYNLSHTFWSLVKNTSLTIRKIAYQQNTRYLLECHVSEDGFQPLSLHDSVII